MERKYEITNEDFKKLKNGSIKYFITYYQCIRYGSRFSWWEAFWINFRSKYGKASYKRPYLLQYYIIYVYAVDKPENLFWSKEAMEEFVKERHLNPGDRVTVSYLHVNDDCISHWGAGVDEFVILEEGWKRIGRMMGA